MSCCGQKRAMQNTAAAPARARRKSSSFPPLTAEEPRVRQTNQAVLRYLGSGTLSLRSPHTEWVYYFDAAGNATVVDENDVDALLRTGLFRREAR